MSSTPRADVYAQVTDAICAALESGARPWSPRWSGPGLSGLPLRGTGEAYRGINVLLLWHSAAVQGFAQPRWLTFKQALEAGGAVRKGEKGTRVVYAGRLTRDAGEGETGDENGEVRIPFLKGYTVFNVEQCDGLGADWFPVAPADLPEHERDARAEAFFGGVGADIRHGGGAAFFDPAADFIQLPVMGAFTDAEAYYATLAHEAVHWSGHRSRLARDLSGRFKSASYAAEELIAEIGAAYLCASLGLSAEPRDDHASYVASWLKVLRDDKRAIFTAASAAQAAADYLHGLAARAPVALAA